MKFARLLVACFVLGSATGSVVAHEHVDNQVSVVVKVETAPTDEQFRQKAGNFMSQFAYGNILGLVHGFANGYRVDPWVTFLALYASHCALPKGMTKSSLLGHAFGKNLVDAIALQYRR